MSQQEEQLRRLAYEFDEDGAPGAANKCRKAADHIATLEARVRKLEAQFHEDSAFMKRQVEENATLRNQLAEAQKNERRQHNQLAFISAYNITDLESKNKDVLLMWADAIINRAKAALSGEQEN